MEVVIFGDHPERTECSEGFRVLRKWVIIQVIFIVTDWFLLGCDGSARPMEEDTVSHWFSLYSFFWYNTSSV